MLIKPAAEVTFTFKNKLCKQIDECIMVGRLSAYINIYIHMYYIYIYIYTCMIYIYIYMAKMEIDVVRPLKSFFYSR